MRKIILSCFVGLAFLAVACSNNPKSIELTEHLTWSYIDETNSSLLWDQKIIIGPGSITLKCGKIYVWGMEHKQTVSTFFILNLKTGEIIKNPEIWDIVHKYNIQVDFNQGYTQAEIFGEQKSMLAMKRLMDDIKRLKEEK